MTGGLAFLAWKEARLLAVELVVMAGVAGPGPASPAFPLFTRPPSSHRNNPTRAPCSLLHPSFPVHRRPKLDTRSDQRRHHPLGAHTAPKLDPRPTETAPVYCSRRHWYKPPRYVLVAMCAGPGRAAHHRAVASPVAGTAPLAALLDSALSSCRHTLANLHPPGQAPVSDATLQTSHEARNQGCGSTANLLSPQLEAVLLGAGRTQPTGYRIALLV